MPTDTNSQPLNRTQSDSNRQIMQAITLLAVIACALAVAAFTFFATADKSKVTAVLITYKQSILETFEFGEDELFIELEYERDGQQEVHQTQVIPVTKLGNGVTWDVTGAGIGRDELRRLRVLDEDLISDDIYDSVDVTLGEPLVGSRYAFTIFQSYPNRNVYRPLFYASVIVFVLIIILSLRRIAR